MVCITRSGVANPRSLTYLIADVKCSLTVIDPSSDTDVLNHMMPTFLRGEAAHDTVNPIDPAATVLSRIGMFNRICRAEQRWLR